MGLAGRDPIFHAQLESEMAILVEDAKNPPQSGLKGPLKETQQAVTNTCLSCHGEDIINRQRLTRVQWEREVDKMVRWGAQVPPDQKTALIDYLSTRFKAQ